MKKQDSKKSISLSAARRVKTSPSQADSAASTEAEVLSSSNKCASPAESCPDGPRYKACGNAVTVNVAQWGLERLARYA